MLQAEEGYQAKLQLEMQQLRERQYDASELDAVGRMQASRRGQMGRRKVADRRRQDAGGGGISSGHLAAGAEGLPADSLTGTYLLGRDHSPLKGRAGFTELRKAKAEAELQPLPDPFPLVVPLTPNP